MPLTWQQVAVPQLDPSRGIEATSAMLDRALQYAHAGVQNQIDMQNTREQFNQQAATRSIMQAALGANDKDSYQKLLDAGLAKGVVTNPDGSTTQFDPHYITPETLQMLDARKDILNRRSDEALAEKQRVYEFGKEQDRDTALKQAGPIFDKYTDEFRNNPQLGLAHIHRDLKAANINLSLEDEEKLAQSATQGYIRPDYEGARLADQRMLMGAQVLAGPYAQQISQQGASLTGAKAINDIRTGIKDGVFKGVRIPASLIQQETDRLVSARDPNYGPHILGQNADNYYTPPPGEGQLLSNGMTGGQVGNLLKYALDQSNARQAKDPFAVLLQKNDTDERRQMDLDAASREFVENYNKTTQNPIKVGEVTDHIRDIAERAGVSAPVAAGLLSAFTGEEHLINLQNFGKGLDEKKTDLDNQITKMKNSAATYQNWKNDQQNYALAGQTLASTVKAMNDKQQLEANAFVHPEQGAAVVEAGNRFKTGGDRLLTMIDLIPKSDLPSWALKGTAAAPVTAANFNPALAAQRSSQQAAVSKLSTGLNSLIQSGALKTDADMKAAQYIQENMYSTDPKIRKMCQDGLKALQKNAGR